MTQEEYSKLFHTEKLNLAAFKILFQCDKEKSARRELKRREEKKK
jgi:hypothetical protein